jgi:hypothetical protein
VPSQEELELVTSANVPAATLGLAERFVFHVGSIPRLQRRLECFLYMQRFNAALHALYTDVHAVRAAAERLRNSAALRRLLGTTLCLGNRLNAGSYRAGAEGFKTECLSRLAELRTNRTHGSLLQYAVSTLAAAPTAAAVGAWGSEIAQQLDGVTIANRTPNPNPTLTQP